MVRRIACLVILLAGAARADTVRLTNGEELEGKAEQLSDGSVRLELPSGIKVTFVSDQYESVTYGATTRDRYEEKRKALAPDSAPGHFLLGTWCRQHGLQKEAEAEFREVLRIDPDHAEARQALGYVRQGTTWITKEELHRRRGEVFFEGRWLAEEKKARILAKRAARKRRLRLLRLIDRAAGTGEPADEALAKLRAAPRREVIEALVEGLKRSVKARVFSAAELRRYTVTGKTKFTVAKAVARIVVTGSAVELREAGIATLKALKWSETPLLLCPYLYNSERLTRIYALQALLIFPDVRAIEHILNSFVLAWEGSTSGSVLGSVSAQYVKGYEIVSGGTGPNVVQVALPRIGGITVGSAVGSGGKNSEDRRRRAEAYLRFAVLHELTGQSFGADYKGWKRWWVREGRAAIRAQVAAAKAKKKEARQKKEPLPADNPGPR